MGKNILFNNLIDTELFKRGRLRYPEEPLKSCVTKDWNQLRRLRKQERRKTAPIRANLPRERSN
jgi:hypothetical protein